MFKATFEILQLYPVAAYSLIFIFGLVLGSFANVVIARLPKMMSAAWQAECIASFPEQFKDSELAQADAKSARTFNLAIPASHCPQCEHKLAWFENIPVFSFLILKGQCRGCHTKISWQYPLIELIVGLLFIAVLAKFGLTANSLAYGLLLYFLVMMTVIDAKHYILPDILTLPLLWIGLIFAQLELLPVSLAASLWGAVLGYLSLWSIYWIFKLITGKEGMGYGDFKLFAVLGAWFGALHLPFLILLAALTGALWGIGLGLLKQRQLSQAIPFGPFLAFAAGIQIFFGSELAQFLGVFYL